MTPPPMIHGVIVIGILMERDDATEVRISTKELMTYDARIATFHDAATDEFVIQLLPPIGGPKPIKKE